MCSLDVRHQTGVKSDKLQLVSIVEWRVCKRLIKLIQGQTVIGCLVKSISEERAATVIP